MAYYCFKCHNEIEFLITVGIKVGRLDTCDHCGAYMHACKNCRFYDPDRHNDCDYAVDLFDGRTGKQRPVMDAASPIGHRIASVDERTVVIRRVLDNCSSQARRDAFEERCWSLDLDTLTLDAAACP